MAWYANTTNITSFEQFFIYVNDASGQYSWINYSMAMLIIMWTTVFVAAGKKAEGMLLANILTTVVAMFMAWAGLISSWPVVILMLATAASLFFVK